MALGSEYRTVIVFLLQPSGNQVAIVRNWRVTAGPSADDPTCLALAVENDLVPSLQGVLPTNVQINSVRVTPSNDPDLDLATEFIGVNGNFGSDQHLPPQVASLIRLVWTGPSTRHPGKVFVPAVPVCSTAGMVSDYLDALSVFAPKLLEISFDLGGGATTFTGVVWHRASGDSSTILSAQVDNHYWTQRDRAWNTGLSAIVQYPMAP